MMLRVVLVLAVVAAAGGARGALRGGRYLDVMEKAFGAYGESGARAYFARVKKEGVTEHGFPRLAANLSVLVARGRLPGLRALAEEMTGFACEQMNRQNRGGNDFSVRELATAIEELEKDGKTSREKIAAWKGELAKIVPEKCYQCVAPGADVPVGNWAMFNAVSELARMRLGVTDWARAGAYVEKQIASQLLSFTKDGMYRDPHNPMVYDSVTRGLVMAAAALGSGIRGSGLDVRGLEELVERAAEPLLEMQSVTGELAFGGRSNQCLHNEAQLALQFEWYATHFARKGNARLAGECKDAAALALEAINRWLAAAPGRHVKNRFAGDAKMFGCEGYAYFEKYMITLASFIYLADRFADDAVKPVACPARRAAAGARAAVFRTDEAFHKVFASAGGYFLEFDTAADFRYDGSGLGRVHKAGAPEALCVSVPFPGPEAKYATGPVTNRAPFALCGARGSGTARRDVGAEGRYSVSGMSADTGAGFTEVELASAFGFLERYRVDKDGVGVSVRGGRVFLFPVLETDGAESPKVTVRRTAVEAEWKGWRCRWEVADGEIADTGERRANRNGIYRVFAATGRDARVDVRIVIEPARAETACLNAETVRVTGDGTDTTRWRSAKVPLLCDSCYLFRFDARSEGTGTLLGGAGCANFDTPVDGAAWRAHTNVFRTPAGAGTYEETFHLGHWHLNGTAGLDAARCIPVRPVYARAGELELGPGEQVDGRTYSFAPAFGALSRNHARPLEGYRNTHFNSTRWCLSPGSEVIYRHELPGRTWRAAKVSVTCGHYAGGTARVEVARDGGAWETLGVITNSCTLECDVPAGLLPARILRVRLRGEKPCSLQIPQYAFEGTFAGAEASLCGAVTYVADGDAERALCGTPAAEYFTAAFGENLGGTDAVDLWRASSGWKIPPGRALPAAGARAEGIEIRAAANEAEAAQLVVRPKTALRGARVTAEVPGLNAAVDVLRVGYVRIKTPTDAAGCRGLWPDPLFEQTDAGADLAAGVNQPFWIRVKPAKGAKPGVYRGTARVTAAGGVEARVPLTVEVFAFALPDEMTCETAFGYAPQTVARYHGLKTAEQKRAVNAKYLRALAEHHISPYNPAPDASWRVTWKNLPPYRKGATDPEALAKAEPVFEWEAWDRAMEAAFAEWHFNTFKMHVEGLGWGTFAARHEPSYKGYPADDPGYDILMAKYLGGIEAHLRAKGGWTRRTCIGSTSRSRRTTNL